MQTNEKAQQEYGKMVKKASPSSHCFIDCCKAFVSGGLICAGGQLLMDLYSKGFDKEQAGLLVSITLIGIASILTGMGIYEKLGKFCGAGTIVPITGFANSMVSPAIEFKKEGLIFGMAAKMFILAGPVIVYGTIASMIVGIFYFFVGKVM